MKLNGNVGARVLGWMGYPSFARKMLNVLPFGPNITADGSVVFKRGCHIAGDIDLGEGVVIGRGCTIIGDIDISRGTSLGTNCYLTGKVDLGNHCAIAPQVSFQARNHDMYKPGMQMRFYKEVLGETHGRPVDGPIQLGSDVWVGRNAILLPDITVNHGAVIGAGAVVTRDVEPYSIVAGVPATHIDYRFDEDTREALLDIEWWTWDEETMRSNKEFFTTDLRTTDDVYSLIEEYPPNDGAGPTVNESGPSLSGRQTVNT